MYYDRQLALLAKQILLSGLLMITLILVMIVFVLATLSLKNNFFFKLPLNQPPCKFGHS